MVAGKAAGHLGSSHNAGVTPRLRLYLAGPDVFRPDAAGHGRRLVALCARHGFDAVFPLDPSLPAGVPWPEAARRIYAADVAHIAACDAVLANLDFFRGAEPDSGTCFEVGYAVARGKPVIGYVPEAGSFAERIRQRHPQVAGVGPADAAGWLLEEFGLPLNLMLGVSCRIVVGGVEAALEAAREVLARDTAATR
ncbi:MAG: nucleoside 2-deoxyribosyltransferase [Burkholderiales bacterium]|nr:nucleoside 2-deoxyribosyltransferase [Burkholderiales bacterium]